MRNLKKVLTLVLTLAMLLSVMVVGAGAAFTDQSSIVNKEAVDMCTALNIIGGYEDGSFRPNGNVTRAEMCKMLCIVLNGGKEPVMSSSGGTYADVERGNWAEPYIEYCTNLGIVGGVGGGNFAPTGNVTGTQAAKMLLVALGFNPSTEGYVGSSNWNIEINVDASQKGLYDTLASIDTEAALTRDQAAQMIWNALGAYMVTYRNEFTTVNGQLVAKPVLVDKTSENSAHKIALLEDKYGVFRVEGIVTANEYVTLTANADATHENEGKSQIIVTNDTDINATEELTVTGGGTADTFNVSTGKDEIGKAVVIFVKPALNSTATNRATVVGKVALDTVNNNVLTIDSEMDTDDLNDALKDAGLKTTWDTHAQYYTNGHNDTANAPAGGFSAAADTKNGYVIHFIDNDGDSDVDYILREQVDFGKVTSYSTKDDGSITVTSVNYKYVGGDSSETRRIVKTDSSDVVGFQDVAKDDFVLYSEVGGRVYLEKAKTVSGILTNYSSQVTAGPAEASLWVDGTKYDVSGVFGDMSGDLSRAFGYDALDKNGVFYLDACGYVVAVDGDAAAKYAIATYYNAQAPGSGITHAKRAEITFEDGKLDTPVVDTATGDILDGTTAINSTEYFDVSNGVAFNTALGAYSYNSDDELGLNMTNMKTVASTGGGTQTFKYTSGNVLLSLNNKTMRNDATIGAEGSGNDIHMTKDTVVFVVKAKDANYAGLASAKVDTINVYVGKDNVPSMNLTDDGTTNSNKFKIVYYLDSNNVDIKAMLIIAGEVSNATDNHLYVLKVDNTSTDKKLVKAVVGNEVKNITVNYKTNSPITVGQAYPYAVESDGTYTLGSALSGIIRNDVLVVANAKTDGKTIVLRSMGGDELKVTDKTDIALIEDVSKARAISFDDLVDGSVVNVLKNSDNEALGIYVVEEANATKANAFPFGPKASYDGTAFTIDVTSPSAANVKSGITLSDGAICVVLANDASIPDTADGLMALSDTTVDNPGNYDLIVISKSVQEMAGTSSGTTNLNGEGYTKYDVTVTVAP